MPKMRLLGRDERKRRGNVGSPSRGKSMSLQLLDAIGAASPTRIVLVEDSPTQSAVIQGVLERAGWKVVAFTNGYEGLAYVREAPVDLVLLDLFLPDLNGYEICRQLRIEERTQALPVIILSAQQDKADKVKALEAGADDFLSKPVDEAELLARVRAHMRARRLFEQASMSAAGLAAANRELEKASRLKSEFLANMSHELRTPLNAIIGFSEVLLDSELYDMPQGQRTQFLENIRRSGHHLLGLINDILDLSKVEAGRMELRRETIQLHELILGCVAIVQPLAYKKRITLDANSRAGDLTIPADPARVKQILYNLLSNAVKFTPEGGRVTVTAEIAESEARVAVQDTGIGITLADQAIIFDEFQQIDQGPARQQEGTGLGLALVRRLVELHGGRVWVESAPGEGSRFTFTLPVVGDTAQPIASLTRQRTAASEQMLGQLGDSKRSPILVVEDEREAAELLTLHLTRAGYDVYRASTGDEALDMARHIQPFAVTLDVLLPGRDGWEFLSALRSDPQLANVPVIVVSIIDNRELGFALGATDYLVKPIDNNALLGILQRLNHQHTGAVQTPNQGRASDSTIKP